MTVFHHHSSWNYKEWEEKFRPVTFQVDVERARTALIAQEDTDNDGLITINDCGPRHFRLQTLDSDEVEIFGTYHLSNLLQELTLASMASQQIATILGSRVFENPVDRLQRMISTTFWNTLTRRLDEANINIIDEKANSGQAARLYVPHGLDEQLEYYKEVAMRRPELRLEVLSLPPMPIPIEYWRRLRYQPGLLALNLNTDEAVPHGSAYVVPGGRFNEFYYWDSYFSALGLLKANKVEFAGSIIDNMCFMINHYGLMPNANRSYYLQRSQPPFLTDLVLRTWKKAIELNTPGADELLRKGILAAIKEYHSVWMAKARLDLETKLSRYGGEGNGIPPEVEEGHFNWILRRVAEKRGISIAELAQKYNHGELQDAELDDIFRHDRAMRESGHDTTYRLEGQAADLTTIDLNTLLYKYEVEIAWVIQNQFHDLLEVSKDESYTSSYWTEKARVRRTAITKYLWNEETGMFHDYNIVTRKLSPFQSVTTFLALWSGVATQEQADRMVKDVLPRFEEVGGAVSTLKKPHIPGSRPEGQQWDYPIGWAPHQMLLWDGLMNYGFHAEAKRIAYRWVYLLTRIAVDFNGRITERYDVTRLESNPTIDRVEYSNQGIDFKGVNIEGFGWSNASYHYGLGVIGNTLLARLREGFPWKDGLDEYGATL